MKQLLFLLLCYILFSCSERFIPTLESEIYTEESRCANSTHELYFETGFDNITVKIYSEKRLIYKGNINTDMSIGVAKYLKIKFCEISTIEIDINHQIKSINLNDSKISFIRFNDGIFNIVAGNNEPLYD